jgi:hypothetical protein
MQQFTNHLSAISACLSSFTYSVSGALVVCDLINRFMNVLDDHTWLAGALIGLAALVMNFLFQLLTWLTNLIFRIYEIRRGK